MNTEAQALGIVLGNTQSWTMCYECEAIDPAPHDEDCPIGYAVLRTAALALLEAVEGWELDDATIGFAMDRAQIEELLAAARALRQVVGNSPDFPDGSASGAAREKGQ